jgi:hypothetical protein
MQFKLYCFLFRRTSISTTNKSQQHRISKQIKAKTIKILSNKFKNKLTLSLEVHSELRTRIKDLRD